jgi:hypothetical protein
MKRKRKTRKTFTLTQKRGLVNKVTTLITQGLSITKARSQVALANKTTPISLARWSKDMTNNVVKQAERKTVKNGHKVHVTSVDLHVPGQGIVKLDHELLSHISKLAGYTG